MSDHLVIEPVGQYASKWGEGPRFWDNALFYVDIEGHAIIRLCLDSHKENVWNVGERIGAVTPTHDGGLLCAGDSKGVKRTIHSKLDILIANGTN
jgi:sugar lactone lactonase YvrE